MYNHHKKTKVQYKLKIKKVMLEKIWFGKILNTKI